MNQQEMQEVAAIQKRYEARIKLQFQRISLYIEFLAERDLIKEFNDWEETKRANAEANA